MAATDHGRALEPRERLALGEEAGEAGEPGDFTAAGTAATDPSLTAVMLAGVPLVDVPLAAALEASLDGFALLTAVRGPDGTPVDLRFAYVNEVGARLSGHTVAQIVGATVTAIWPSTMKTGLLARYLWVAETGEPYLAEYVDAVVGWTWEVKALRVTPEIIALSFRDASALAWRWDRVAGPGFGPQSSTGALISLPDHRLSAERLAFPNDAELPPERLITPHEVSAALTSPVTVADVLSVMETKVRPATGADGLTVLLINDDRLVVRHDSGARGWQRAGGAREVPLVASSAVASAAARGEALFYQSREEYVTAYPEHHVPVIDPVTGRTRHAWSILPLIASGRTIGVMVLSYLRPRRFGPRDREAQATICDQCAHALDRAMRFEAQQSIAADLQRALLPSTLPVLRGGRHAVRYLPWTHGADVGGDWYDVLRIRPGTIAVVIGDVAGHSTSAAATMGQIRNALRAYAIEGHSPTNVVRLVNRLVTRLDPEALATCCYLELHLDEGTATAVLAGHLPPILRCNGRAEPLQLRMGAPLGVDPAIQYTDTTVVLPPRSALLLYTDGLVEDRRYRIDQGMADLCRVVAAVDDDDPDVIVDEVLTSDVGPNPRSDDVALLAITLDDRPVVSDEATARRRFPSDAGSAPAARRFAGDMLDAWGLADLSHTARLLLGEIITNAVQHTVGDVGVCLSRVGRRLRVEVTDHSERLPDLRGLDPQAESGRGLHIVRTLATNWGYELVETGGKSVWFELHAEQVADPSNPSNPSSPAA